MLESVPQLFEMLQMNFTPDIPDDFLHFNHGQLSYPNVFK